MKDWMMKKYDRFRKAEDGIIYNGMKEYDLGNRDSIIVSYFILSQTLEPLNILFSVFYYKGENKRERNT